MPFSIAAQPTAIALTGNQMVFNIACADPNGDPFRWLGIRSRLLAAGDVTYYSAGNTITLNFQEPDFGPSHSIAFTASATPTGIAQFSSVPGGFASYLAYWQHVANVMDSHPLVAPYVHVYINHVGTNYELIAEVRTWELGWTITFAQSPSVLPLTNYTTLSTTLPTNYRLSADVWAEDSFRGTQSKRAILELIPTAASTVQIDIAEILHNAILKDFPANLPTFSGNIPIIWDIVRNYYLRIWESIGTTSTDYDNYDISSVLLALCGGIANSLHAATDFLGSISSTNSLLTWRPNRRYVDIVQPEWISWYNYTGDIVSPALEVTYTYPDGTSSTGVILTEHGVSVEANQVAIIPVGFLVLDGVARVTAVKYAVRVVSYDEGTSTATPLSQYITYFIDRAYRASTKYILYLNGFNAPEVLRCYGDFDTDLEVSREESEAPLQPGYAANFRQRSQYAQDWDNAYTYYTGYMTRAEAEALQELLVYGRAWEISASAYVPISIDGKKFSITSTRQNLHAYAITAVKAMRERWFVPALPSTAMGSWLIDDEGDPLVDDEGGTPIEG